MSTYCCGDNPNIHFVHITPSSSYSTDTNRLPAVSSLNMALWTSVDATLTDSNIIITQFSGLLKI